MKTRAEFATVDHGSQGRQQPKYAEAQESAPRSLYGLAGLLVINVMAMFKQLAFGAQAEKPRVEDLLDGAHAVDAPDASGHLLPSVPLPPAPAAAREEGYGYGQGVHGFKFHASVSAEFPVIPVAPVPRLSAWREGLHAAAPPNEPTNDNATVRLPFRLPDPSKAEGRSGAGEASSASAAPSGAGDDKKKRGTDAVGEKAEKTSDADEPHAPRNRQPSITGSVNLGELTLNTAMIIGLSDLLVHASDPDGDVLDIANLRPSSGELTAHGDGKWFFVPEANDVSDVTFSYNVTDGQATVAQSARLDLVDMPPEWMIGTDEEDVILGTTGSDQIATRGGSDIVRAMAGDDVIDAGAGDDVIFAGDGDDIVDAGDGNDIVFAGSGDDIVFGGAGNDIIFGENGADKLYGGSGHDEIHGGSGSDVIEAGGGDDVARGDEGSDVFIATLSPPAVTRNASGEELPQSSVGSEPPALSIGDPSMSVAEARRDPSSGAPSPDITTDGDDRYDGGEGIDTLDISATSSDAIVDLSAGFAQSDEIGHDELSSIENTIGGTGNDTLVANGSRNELTGGGGEDTFVFLQAEDTPSSPEQWDSITDFEVGDRIDVSQIDSDETENGQQLFKWKGNADRFENSGEMRYKFESREDGDHTMLMGNTDDDEDEDFVIDVAGWIELTPSNMIGVYAY